MWSDKASMAVIVFKGSLLHIRQKCLVNYVSTNMHGKQASKLYEQLAVPSSNLLLYHYHIYDAIKLGHRHGGKH